LRVSATLHRTNAKKYFWRSKNQQSPKKVFKFSELLRDITKKYWRAELRQKKRPLG